MAACLSRRSTSTTASTDASTETCCLSSFKASARSCTEAAITQPTGEADQDCFLRELVHASSPCSSAAMSSSAVCASKVASMISSRLSSIHCSISSRRSFGAISGRDPPTDSALEEFFSRRSVEQPSRCTEERCGGNEAGRRVVLDEVADVSQPDDFASQRGGSRAWFEGQPLAVAERRGRPGDIARHRPAEHAPGAVFLQVVRGIDPESVGKVAAGGNAGSPAPVDRPGKAEIHAEEPFPAAAVVADRPFHGPPTALGTRPARDWNPVSANARCPGRGRQREERGCG